MGSSFGGNIALQLALRRPDRFAGVIPVEGADYSPGFYLDWWQHPHANAAQVCASGVWDLMAPQSPEADRWKTWFYYTQGSEAFKGDLYFYSVDHDLRDKLGEIDGEQCPVVMLTGDYDYLTTPEDSARTAQQIKNGAVHRDEGHRAFSDEREPRPCSEPISCRRWNCSRTRHPRPLRPERAGLRPPSRSTRRRAKPAPDESPIAHSSRSGAHIARVPCSAFRNLRSECSHGHGFGALAPDSREIDVSVRYVLFVVTNAAVIGPNNRPTGFFFPEIAHPFEALDKAGIAVEFASVLGGKPPEDGFDAEDSTQTEFLGSKAYRRLSRSRKLSEVDVLDYDAIFFPGGLGPMVDVTGNPEVQDAVLQAWNAGMIVSAVCHGPSAFLGVTLGDGAPLVRGRMLTSFSTAEEDGYAKDDVPFDLERALRDEGARFESTDPWQPKLVVDGRLITGQNPQSGTLVGEALAEALAK